MGQDGSEPAPSSTAPPTFDELLGPGNPMRDVRAPRRRLRGDGRSSGRYAVAACSTAALLCAVVAALALTLTIRDVEAEVLVGFSIALQLLALALLTVAAVRVVTVDGIRWPSAIVVAVGALLSAGVLVWAYQAVALSAQYIP